MYAIIQKGGHQYKITPGEELLLDRIPQNEGENLKIKEVILCADGENIDIGMPYVSSAEVILKVLKQEKGEKIDVLRFKAKSRYTKRIGFRSHLTRVKVEKITVSGKTHSTKPAKSRVK